MSIKVDLKIFLFLFLFLLTSQLEIYIVLMIFAILHELGHLIAGIILKFEPEEICITPVGLRLSFKIEPEEYNKNDKNTRPINLKKAIIAISGPFTNLVISTMAIMFAKFNVNFANMYIYHLIVYSNLVIAMFNLIPIYPMDGGRFLKEILKIGFGNKKAYKITYMISKTILIILTAFASIAILYLQNIAVLIIIGYLWYLEIGEIRRYNRRRNVENLVKEFRTRGRGIRSQNRTKGHTVKIMCVPLFDFANECSVPLFEKL